MSTQTNPGIFQAHNLPAGVSADLGLDLTRPDEVTEAEKEAYRQTYQWYGGRPHVGLSFWLEHDERVDILKRYRIWSVSGREPGEAQTSTPSNFGFVYWYGRTGFTAGVRYIVTMMQREGLTRTQILEGIAAAFIWLGPRGRQTVADGLDRFEWLEPARTANYPENWHADPQAFTSGLDFTSPELSDAELARLNDWYLAVEGEVPGYVGVLAANNRPALKMYRQRFETALRILPKQVMPYLMIYIGVLRGHREGIRDGVLLARGFGMTKTQTVEAIASGMFYGGVESGSIADEVSSDILDRWTGQL